MSGQGWLRSVAVAALGLALPLVVLIQAYTGLSHLSGVVARDVSPDVGVYLFKQIQPLAKTANDYALYSLIYSENVNETVIVNKQVMKIVIMQIGFAVSSLGLMFVVLGFNAGGASGKFKFLDVDIDFKTASTGVAVFIIGALMTTAGGVLKNDYTTLPLPNYIDPGAQAAPATDAGGLQAYKTCKAQAGDEFAACFASLYAQLHSAELDK